MHILILGAGVIGVTTAYELLKEGHEVTVIDRQPEPALETSFGNAGLIAPGHSYAWTTPKLPGNLFKLLFPNAFDFSKIEYWAGLRPMTPNGAPILGKGKMDNLYYNTGHGHLGWTMCAGSAKIISDLISENKPELDLEGMTIARS